MANPKCMTHTLIDHHQLRSFESSHYKVGARGVGVAKGRQVHVYKVYQKGLQSRSATASLLIKRN